MPSRLITLAAVLCLSSVLHAQSELSARNQVFAGYSFLSNTINGVPGSRQPLNGWEGSLAFFPWHGLRFKIDTYGYSGHNLGALQRPIFIMGGGQYSWHVRRESIFVDALLGEGSMNKYWGPNQAVGWSASLSTFAGGGLDTPLSQHFSWRASGGYEYAYFTLGAPHIAYPYRPAGLPTNFGRISSGLLWQF
jgi:hypothetical protein